MKVRIAHLSDPHFGTILEGVEAGLLQTLHSLQLDLVLISGDMTQRARRKQFEAARSFLVALRPIPSFAVPGNHDIPLFNLFGRLFAPYRGFHTYFQSERETDLRFGGIRVIGLNSTSKWRHVQGSLDVNRIRESFLDHWDEAIVRVAVVHHPIDCAKTIDDKKRLRGREQIVDLFEKAKIDLVLSGHVHDPFVAIERSMVLSVAGTCLSWRTRKDAPNSFNLIEIDTNVPRIAVTRMDIGDDKLFRPRPGVVFAFTRAKNGAWTSS